MMKFTSPFFAQSPILAAKLQQSGVFASIESTDTESGVEFFASISSTDTKSGVELSALIVQLAQLSPYFNVEMNR
jgi:hypothetical protein